MATCSACGHQGLPGETFCTMCGQTLYETTMNATSQPVTAPPVAPFPQAVTPAPIPHVAPPLPSDVRFAASQPVGLPTAAYASSPDTNYWGPWQDNGKVVVRNGAMLPDICIKTNLPGEGSRFRKKLYWHEPVYYLLLLAGALPYIIVALIVQKKASVDVGLSPKAKSSRLMGMLVGWIGSLLGFFLLMAGASSEDAGFIAIIGLILVPVAMIIGVSMARIVWPTKIADDYVWLAGAHRDYIASLPVLGRR